MTRTIAVSSACLPGSQPLADRVAVLKGEGLSAIELGAGVSVGDDLETVISDREVRFFVHNYFPPPAKSFVLNLASADAGIRAASVNLAVSALELTARLGTPFYSVHGGFITDPVGFDGVGFIFPRPDSPDAESRAMARFTTTLRGLISRARDLGVRILVENNVCAKGSEEKLLLQSAEGFAELFAEVTDPALGVLLDTGHLNVSAATLGFDRGGFVEAVEPYVAAFHVHDNDGGADSHQPVGKGSWVLDVLRRRALRGLPVIIESKFPNAAALSQHASWLESELQK